MTSNCKLIKKITTSILTFFLVLSVIGLHEIYAEDFSLTTEKTKYYMNEPLIVTAKGGKWVGVYKKGETPSETQGYFYRFDVDGESHNIYSEEGKGDRGTVFVSIPQADLKIYLFGDDGYDNILAETDVIHINSDPGTESVLSVDETTDIGKPVHITSKSYKRDAWVGIYKGTYTSSDTYSNKKYLEMYYQAYVNNEGKDIEGLEAGKYTAVLFCGSKYSVDKVVNFEVISELPEVQTDKEVYETGEPILVTVKHYPYYYTDGSDNINTWVGLYKKNETPAPDVSTSWYYLKNEEPVNILDSNICTINNDVEPGEYKVILFSKDGGYNDILDITDITIKSAGYTIETNHPLYTFGVNVEVTAAAITDNCWVGLYKQGEIPSEDLPPIYKYNVVEKYNGGPCTIADATQIDERVAEFTYGDFVVILFGDAGYDKIMAKADFKINPPAKELTLSVDKTEYDYAEPIMVTASNPNTLPRTTWVGLYEKGVIPSPGNKNSKCFFSYTVSDHNGEAVNLISENPNQSIISKFVPGDYTVILFKDRRYTPMKSIDITIKDNGTNPIYSLKTEKTEYEAGEQILVTAFSNQIGSWVGIYKKDEIPGEIPSIYWYYVNASNGMAFDILQGKNERPNEFSLGEYEIVLFKDEGYDPVDSISIIVKNKTIEDGEIITEPTCTEYGYARLDSDTSKNEYTVIEPLGHDWGEWKYDEENRNHFRICSRDSEHIDRESCEYDEGTVIKEASGLIPGMIQYTCSVCGGSYTEEYESDNTIVRLFGATRYETSITIADSYKAILGTEKFEAVVLTTGEKFPDALAGSYLANLHNAPILLINKNTAANVGKYIRENLKDSGIIYVLGGETVVKEEWVKNLKGTYKVKRLSGATRYETNLDILKESGFSGGDILVCVGRSINAAGDDTAYADSLSGSSVGLPIFLVDKKTDLTEEQKQYLKSFTGNLNFYIIGGTAAVPENVEKKLKSYGTVAKRLAGNTRYETSILVAQEFFNNPNKGVLAYGKNFPDGLCGGPLAAALGAPVILSGNESKEFAAGYYKNNKISKTIVLGGTKLISDETVKYILYSGASPDIGKQFRIKYILNGGVNNTSNPFYYTKGDTAVLEKPVKSGYLFDGWYLDSSFTTSFKAIEKDTSGDLTLYAKWKAGPLDITVSGMDNMIWTWWYYPQVISHDNKVFWGFAENSGYSGIAEYDQNTGKTKKTFLKKVSKVDDHNGVALTLMDDGRILCAFAGGHNTDNNIHIRISNDAYDAEDFDTEIILKSSGKTCYSQLLRDDDTIYLFYRVNNTNWAYRYTEDGVSWSNEIILVVSPEQYYCKIMPTTKKGLFRICMYSNPTGSNPDIRMGFINAFTGMVYNADGKSYLGLSEISYSAFDIVISCPEGMTQRMFDVAITAPESPRILISRFVSNKTDRDSEYYLYDNGNMELICHGGNPLWNPKYQLGASFLGDSEIVVGRNAEGTDYIELYSILSNEIRLEKSIYSETTAEGVRNARPINDINGKAILWHRGYYNENSYTDFDTDGKIEIIK